MPSTPGSKTPAAERALRNLPALAVGGSLNVLWAPMTPALAGARQGAIHVSVSIWTSEDQIPDPKQAQKIERAGSLTALEFFPACGISYCVSLDTGLGTPKLNFPHL